MRFAANGPTAQLATGQAFVPGHGVVRPGIRRKRPVADRAVDAGIVFVFVAEHGGGGWISQVAISN
jgi:hypothetical protein